MLILVRHGETAANVAGQLLGRADPPLTEQGRRQADALRVALAGAARVVASPLRRARETAGALGLPVEVDDRWVELDYGELEGTPVAAVAAEVWDRWRADVEFAPPKGESLACLGARVRAACESLAGEAATSDVVVVSHVSPIKAAVAWALGAGDEVAWRMYLDTACISRIAIGPRGPSLRSFNELHHLAPPGDRAGPG